MFKQNEKAISQIAEYIPRACRGMQLQEAKAHLEKKSRSIPMTAVMLPFLTRRLLQLLTVILGSLFFRASQSSCMRGPNDRANHSRHVLWLPHVLVR
ncbi:Uncharacterised protein [Klebsiella pneumoniae]|nr:Uncharacterised protein [Klebsiella pneumoniae]